MHLYVVVVQNKDSGYSIQLRLRRAATVPDMQSRKLRSAHEAKHEAQRIFGPLNWISREDAELTGQPYVVCAAEIEVL